MERTIDSASNSLEKAHQYIRAIQKNNLDGGSLPEDTSLTDRKIGRPVNQKFATFFCSFYLCNLHVGNHLYYANLETSILGCGYFNFIWSNVLTMI
jgi:hypothetical protein